MRIPTISAIIDRAHPKKDNTCSVSIRVTYERRKRHYPTGMSLEASEFDRIIKAKRLAVEDRFVLDRIRDYESKAREAATKVNVFTFDSFEKTFLRNRGAGSSIKLAFEEYAEELRSSGNISTSEGYKSASKSFEQFRSDLRFTDKRTNDRKMPVRILLQTRRD